MNGKDEENHLVPSGQRASLGGPDDWNRGTPGKTGGKLPGDVERVTGSGEEVDLHAITLVSTSVET